jgi:hypothetical protein
MRTKYYIILIIQLIFISNAFADYYERFPIGYTSHKEIKERLKQYLYFLAT